MTRRHLANHVLPIVAVVVASCSEYDRIHTTEMRPTENGFVYKAIADATYPIDSDSAETERIGWMNKFVSDNNLRPSGYKIERRDTVLINRGLLGDVYDVFYTATCL